MHNTFALTTLHIYFPFYIHNMNSVKLSRGISVYPRYQLRFLLFNTVNWSDVEQRDFEHKSEKYIFFPLNDIFTPSEHIYTSGEDNITFKT